MEGFKYNSDFSTITSIVQVEQRVYLNALCATPTIKEASIAVGVSENTLFKFIKEYELSDLDIDKMRLNFLSSKRKIILKYANGKTKKINC